MNDTWVSIREFEGFSKRMDGQFQQVSESTLSLHGKLDSLLVRSSEEARSMGAMESTVRSLETRMGSIESEIKTLKDAFSNREIQKVDKRLGWFGQMVALLIASFAGGLFARIFK